MLCRAGNHDVEQQHILTKYFTSYQARFKVRLLLSSFLFWMSYDDQGYGKSSQQVLKVDLQDLYLVFLAPRSDVTLLERCSVGIDALCDSSSSQWPHQELNSEDILQNAARASASTNFQYYSVNVGVTHNIFLSSYTDYTVGSAQYNWLLNDLQSIDRSKTPW